MATTRFSREFSRFKLIGALDGGKPSKNKLRFELGGRAGYGIPYGDAVANREMSEYFKGVIPLQADAWLRVRGFALGLYFGFGFGLDGEALDGCDDCSLSSIRLGLQAAWHLNDGGFVDPWFGLGAGFEWMNVAYDYTSVSGYAYRADIGYRALPELIAQVGLDLGGGPIAVGPFASVSYARYSKVEGSFECKSLLGCGTDAFGETTSDSMDIDETGGHGWLLFGIRGYFVH